MRAALLHTARGHASIALAGVLLIACAATLNIYQGAREHGRDRAIITLVARQQHLARNLSLSGEYPSSQALIGQIAAGDANLQLLLAMISIADSGDPTLEPRLDATRQAWASFRRAVAGQGPNERRIHATALTLHLDALATRYKQHLATTVRTEAGRQAIILACAAPLLAWAFLAVGRAAMPPTPTETPLPTGTAACAARTRTRFEWRDIAQAGAAPSHPKPAHGNSGSLAGALDLAHELRTYAADFRQISGVTIELALDERAAAAVPPSARTQALTIAREAIADTRRDEQATHISVALWQEPGGVWLAVADDGLRAAHTSMAITRARAERIGGELRVCPQSDGGTLVLARLPLGEPAEAYGAPQVRAPRRAW